MFDEGGLLLLNGDGASIFDFVHIVQDIQRVCSSVYTSVYKSVCDYLYAGYNVLSVWAERCVYIGLYVGLSVRDFRGRVRMPTSRWGMDMMGTYGRIKRFIEALTGDTYHDGAMGRRVFGQE